MPLVSVIIPTYNRASRLEEAVRSVLDQTFRDFELIVVDDGSTDGTREMLEGFGAGVKVLVQARSGVSAARNLGIEAARGPLIAFLDSDDLWLDRKLEVQAAHFRMRPKSLICQTEEVWIRKGRRVNPKAYHKKRSGNIFRISLERCMVSPSAVMLRRSLLEEVGVFDTSMEACEDYDLWLRVACRHPVALIDEPLTIKRGGHSDQLSRTVPSLDRLRIHSLSKLLSANVLSIEQTGWVLETLRRKTRIYAEGCLKRGKLEEALQAQKLLPDHQERPSNGPGMQALPDGQVDTDGGGTNLDGLEMSRAKGDTG
ncbi:MAG: glycosyltransferase [Deltaproteobacteria bacterium]|nr:glycosyltransferase [Deltaproteobacteria bacterium]